MVMETPDGNTEEKQQQLLWVDAGRTFTEYPPPPPHIQASVPGSSFIITQSSAESLQTQYTTLSALQGSFIAIQQPSAASPADYQALQGYQPVYISGNRY